MTTARAISTFEELDYRENDGIEVSLLWSRADDSMSVVVFDSRADSLFEVPVGADEAMDVFRHPFAYEASRSRSVTPLASAGDLSQRS